MTKETKNLSSKEVDQYISKATEDAKMLLNQIRKMIQDTVPDAEEKISYGVPAYKYYGMLVSFGVAKNHVGFYVMDPALMNEIKEELKGYDTATGTIRFPFDKPLPVTLVKKIIKARVKRNEEAFAKKKSKK